MIMNDGGEELPYERYLRDTEILAKILEPS